MIGPPVDIDKLDTLPEDLELVECNDPLEKPPVGYYHVPVSGHWKHCQDLTFKGDVIPFYVLRRFKNLLKEAVKKSDAFKGNLHLNIKFAF